jgi:hypothetical protein
MPFKVTHALSPVHLNTILTPNTAGKFNLTNQVRTVILIVLFQVKPDMLQLRVPVWVSDMDFIQNSAKVAVCTRYGHVSIHL